MQISTKNAKIYKKATEVIVLNINDDFNAYLEKFALVSNEISNPISNISAITQIFNLALDNNNIDIEIFKGYLKQITENCDKHERTINNLVSHYFPSPLDYNLLAINDFAEKFSSEIQSYAHKYGFDFSYSMSIQDDEFYLPVSLIEKILLNLIVNAIQNNSKKKKKVSLTIQQDKGTLLFTLKDNGDGIKPEDLPEVTEAFYHKRNTEYSGLGLGLTLIKNSLNAIGGTLDIKSSIKRGTEIIFTIPTKNFIQLRSGGYVYKPSPSFFRTEFSALYKK